MKQASSSELTITSIVWLIGLFIFAPSGEAAAGGAGIFWLAGVVCFIISALIGVFGGANDRQGAFLSLGVFSTFGFAAFALTQIAGS